MPSRTAKGNYHRKRTKEWLESQGFTVAVLESTFRIFTTDKATGAPRVIFSKRDVWGADLAARDAERLVFVQVKANAGDIPKGIKELSIGPWPKSVERWVAHWPARRRSAEGPDIHEIKLSRPDRDEEGKRMGLTAGGAANAHRASGGSGAAGTAPPAGGKA